MTRYEKQNAAIRIDGYYDLRPHEAALEKKTEAFERAKSETLKQMRDALVQTEALTLDDFFSGRRNASSRCGDVADAIHYPECWDTAAYPTVLCALEEIYAWFRCNNDDCGRMNKAPNG